MDFIFRNNLRLTHLLENVAHIYLNFDNIMISHIVQQYVRAGDAEPESSRECAKVEPDATDNFNIEALGKCAKRKREMMQIVAVLLLVRDDMRWVSNGGMMLRQIMGVCELNNRRYSWA